VTIFERVVRAALRQGRLFWFVVLLLAVPAVFRTVQLYAHLRADIEALLPRSAPSVLALEELKGRMAGLKFLGVIVDTGDAANLPKGEAFLDALAERVKAYPPDLVRRVATGKAEEREFLEKNAALYLETADLVTIRDRIAARRDFEVSKSTGMNLDDDEEPPSLDFKDIEDRARQKLPPSKPGESDTRFSSKEKHLTLLLIEAGAFDGPNGKAATLLERVKADVADLGGVAKVGPGMALGYTGDIAISVEETEALMADLSVSSLVVLILVVLVIWQYFRWPRSIAILLPSLGVATAFAFSVASLPPFRVTELNSNTAFLGSIVVGNGINFGIMLLARYVEERRTGAVPIEAMVVATRETRGPTLGAAMAAGCSYLALAVTDFQGFRQFGFIGGLGMAFSWLGAYLLVPSLAVALDDDRHGPRAESKAIDAVFAALSRGLHRAPRAVVLVALLATVASVGVVVKKAPGSLELDMSRLRRRDTWEKGEGYWGRKMDSLLGTYLTPMAILVDDAAAMRKVRQAIDEVRTHDDLADLLSHTRTVDDVLPADQDRKLVLLKEIRTMLTPKIRASIPEDRREALDRFVGGEELKKLAPEDLPRTFTRGLRENDGRMDRVVLVYPKTTRALWDGTRVTSLVATLRSTAGEAVGAGQPRPRLAGSLPISADIVSSLGRDGPLATAAAFFGVVVVVLVLFRFSAITPLVLATLVASVLWLAAATLGLGMRINFANFIAFPITFGIGVDYVVNVLSRWREGGENPVENAVRHAGSAVALCSLTTIIGYSSLLLAENRALFLFGVMAVVGELACLIGALVVAPSAILWVNQRTTPPPSRGAGTEPEG
jgi:uncharacterized protein